MKKYRTLALSCIVLILLCLLSTFSSRLLAGESERKEVENRAYMIAYTLPDAPNYGVRAKDDIFWSRLAAKNKLGVVKKAETYLETPPTRLTSSLYHEYYGTGNRSHYEIPYFETLEQLNAYSLAERYEKQGRFIEPLNKLILTLCKFPSWVLPAHDKNAYVYDGNDIYSDLGSTMLGAHISVAINLHQDKLPKETIERAKQEIERRLLQPYREAVDDAIRKGMGWVRARNKWNPVCHAGTVCAALNILDSKEDRAFFLGAADYFLETYYLASFPEDGYYSEGLEYWNDGFGKFVMLGAMARNATNGALDMFRFPKMRTLLDYAPNQEIYNGLFASFADCGFDVVPDALTVGYLSRLKKFGYTEYEQRALGSNFYAADQMKIFAFAFNEDVTLRAVTEYEEHVPYKRSDFRFAGVTICRPNPTTTGGYLAAAFKGGHNDELHNHNDVGSYTLIAGHKASSAPDVYIVCDPGAEEYTARTFSPRRYDGELLNSYGHPVPVVAGKLQTIGSQARGERIGQRFTDLDDTITYDISSAYDVPELKRLDRTFEYRRARQSDAGFFRVTDYVLFKEDSPQEFETAIVTYEEATIESYPDRIEVAIGPVTLTVQAFDKNAKPQQLEVYQTTVGAKDSSVTRKPARIAFKLASPMESSRVVQQFVVN